jgi:AcrR family transcriptional regulator
LRLANGENTILLVENDVLDDVGGDRALADRSVDRSLEGQRRTYAAEVRKLIDASFEQVRVTGCIEPTVGEIVRAAGLSNKAFYRHFRSKDELLLAVLDDGIRQLSRTLQERMAASESPLAQVRAWIVGLLDQALNPEAAAATRPFARSRSRLAELFPVEVGETERQLTERLREAIALASECGELETVDAQRDAAIVYQLTMGWVERSLAGPTPPDRDDAQHLTDFCLRGILRTSEPRN